MSDQNILHVARKIVESLNNDLTPLKLQKLTYYCQAWSLVWEEKPLFDEEFQAWANGPVNPLLYSKHRGTYKINMNFLEEYSGHNFTQEDRSTIKVVLDFYGDKAPFYLSELTHKERPWKEARGDTPPGQISEKVITKESMQEYYLGISTQ